MIASNYHVFWHWGEYQYYQTSSEDIATKFYNSIESGASRVMIYQGQVVKEWYCNNEWENNIWKYVQLYLKDLPKIRVVWHWGGKYHNETFRKLEDGYKKYSSLNHGATRLLSINDTIPLSWYCNDEWKKKLISHWTNN